MECHPKSCPGNAKMGARLNSVSEVGDRLHLENTWHFAMAKMV
jgi:hypothetical protein